MKAGVSISPWGVVKVPARAASERAWSSKENIGRDASGPLELGATKGSPIEAPFSDRLIERVRTLGHPLCVGIDPFLDRIPPLFRRGAMDPHDPHTAQAVEAFCLSILDRVAGKVAIVKPQSAFFEVMGHRGVRVLQTVLRGARERGLLALLDAKRGDIGSTAQGYADALLGPHAAAPADALTVSPYLGLDTLEPFVARSEREGTGLFVLVRTSNPGARDFQDLHVEGRPLYQQVAASLAPLAERLKGQCGWSSLGVVVGATWPEESRAVRALLPGALFLVPGYGAQGAGAGDALAGFVSGPKGLEGGVVASSRAVLFPEAAHTEDRAAWEKAIDDALARAVEPLAVGVRG